MRRLTDEEQERRSDTSTSVTLPRVRNRIRLSREPGGNGEEGHGRRLSSCSPKHELSSTDLLDEIDGEERGKKVLGSVARSEDLGLERGESDGGLVDSCRVVGDHLKSQGRKMKVRTASCRVSGGVGNSFEGLTVDSSDWKR